MGVSKVILDGVTQIDLSQDTVSVENLYAGESAVAASGDKIFGEAQRDNEDTLLEKTISGVYSNSSITAVRSFAFQRQYGLTKVILPNVTAIGLQGFYYCTGLEEAEIPNLTSLNGTSIFSADAALTSINLGSVTTIPSYTFANCTSLTSTDIVPITCWDSSFYNCTSLESINLSKVTNIRNYAFKGCKSLKKVESSTVTWLHNTGCTQAFYGCSNLEEVNFPNLSSIYNGGQFFANCSKLKKVNLPKLDRIYAANVFQNCTSLEGIVLPNLVTNNAQSGLYTTFNGCTSLKYVDTNRPYQIYASTFANSSLDTLILRGAFTTSLANINAFTGTPFASDGTGGILYVPSARVSSYESATNWSTILGYENNQIKSIESTHEDPDAPIDLTLYYIDGTPIT